ncbi:hypothetical protein DICPUDRAFT_86661 [Dictyostelium purpureum]|uniref:N-acetyltransferase domain-containing protein n=1 Tax=Dictyostelium purpureum TaxID=5786 RepID=F0ZD54_DICPU|nr:uncharacterized protein DICPUDRAFT_86661 [Dictyostelium purpureum]EGC38145.1 hypothetical protein DICPUDRAFT_86661 [Dictyostelium purpureum]|eukprot:XP_003285359.1 hypothetical protein DICPUDRAFT_86661 [Dictyostelium purpureum]
MQEEIILSTTDFNTLVFEDIKKIRYEVFVIEQQCPQEEEWDEYDESSKHLLLKVNGEPVGCARWRKVYYPKYDGNMECDVIKLERFAILKQFRGKSFGKELVKQVIKHVYQTTNIDQSLNYPLFMINAQQYVENFYSSLGFETDKNIPIFDEAGILHVRMIITNDKIKKLYFSS